LLQDALERHGLGDGSFEPRPEPFGTCDMHVADVLKGLRQGDFDPQTVLGRRQFSQKCFATLVALHEGNDPTAFEMLIVALGSIVTGTWETDRSKTVEPQCLRIALALDQKHLLCPIQTVQPMKDCAMPLRLLVPKHPLVTVR
jgi:hypothetical protein